MNHRFKIVDFSLIFLLFLLLVACRPDRSIDRPVQGSRPAIYRLTEDEQLRHIEDWATFLALGYRADQVLTRPDQELAAYPLGPPLTRWLAGPDDSNLYFLEEGRRRLVPDLETMEAMGGSPTQVSLVEPGFFNRLPLAEEPLPALTRSADQQSYPQVTAALWAGGFLWTANETGLLTRWDTGSGQYQEYPLPGRPPIQALAAGESQIYAGTETGEIWQITVDGRPTRLAGEELGWISALAVESRRRDGASPAPKPEAGRIWFAEAGHFNPERARYRPGRGIGRLEAGAIEMVPLPEGQPVEASPLQQVTALAVDPHSKMLWAATRSAGLFGYDLTTKQWIHEHPFNSGLSNNVVNDLELAAGGVLWLATSSGVSRYDQGVWENYRLAEGVSEKGALSLTIAPNGQVWVGGDDYIAWGRPETGWQVHTALEQPLLAGRYEFVVLDGADRPWFFSRRRKLHFDGRRWLAFGADVRRFTEFRPATSPPANVQPPPLDFPAPQEDYPGWLRTWPRPENDNGRGMHFVQSHWLDEIEAQQQVNRLKRLNVRWALVPYANHYQLQRLAPLFEQAGIMVVWRPFVRPYETYDHWAEDVQFLRARGLPPYIQLYNEPSLAQEWDGAGPIDRELYLDHLLPAIEQVYRAGGYVGLQFIDPEWLRATLQSLEAEEMTYVFDRLFFIPHPYGLNHPPEYDEDINGVLGFLKFADLFEAEIGFVPAMIAGEGGWRPGEAQDNRYPPVSERMHRDYHLALFDWFRTGRLSNGDPLPDYLLAFCPWLLSDPVDPAAWFDSAAGDRTLTIEAIEAMPPFERTFSWDE